MKRLLFILIAGLLLSVSASAGTAEEPKAAAPCPLAGKEIVSVEKDVALSGKIVCAHCNLHRGNSCKDVFQAADGKVYDICPDSLEGWKKLKGKAIEATTTVYTLKDADPAVRIEAVKTP